MSEEVVHGYAVYNYNLLDPDRFKSKTAAVNAVEDQAQNGISALIPEIEEHENDSEVRKLSCRLSLLSSNIQVEQETSLRSYLHDRLERIHPLEGSGNISSIPAGKVYDKNAMVYFYLMNEQDIDPEELDEQGNSNQGKTFLICFVAILEMGLELFHSELDKYCQSLSPYLHRYMESIDVSEYLKKLEAWYEINICFIQRCFAYLDNQLASLVFSSFIGEEVTLKGLSETASNDIQSFMACCSLSELLQDKSYKNMKRASKKSTRRLLFPSLLSFQDFSMSPRGPRKTSYKGSVEITFENEKYELINPKTNVFCKDCIKALKQVGLENHFKLRQVVETYKLKVIQDMNTFKRLSKQAETDYYALYRTYSFLISCDNGDVLLKNAKVQCEDDSTQSCKDVLDVLQQFIQAKAGFAGIQKEGKSIAKAQYLLRLLDH